MASIKFIKEMDGITLNKEYDIIEKLEVDSEKYFKFTNDYNEIVWATHIVDTDDFFEVIEDEKEILNETN